MSLQKKNIVITDDGTKVGIFKPIPTANFHVGVDSQIDGSLAVVGQSTLNGIYLGLFAGSPTSHMLRRNGNNIEWWNGSTWTALNTGGGGGETNTASNVGSGSGVFKQKTSSDLEFKSIEASTGIGISDNTNEIQIYALLGFEDVPATATLTIGQTFGKHVILDTTSNIVNATLPTPTASENGKRFSVQVIGNLGAFIIIPGGITHVIAGATASPIPLPGVGDSIEIIYRHTPAPTYYLI